MTTIEAVAERGLHLPDPQPLTPETALDLVLSGNVPGLRDEYVACRSKVLALTSPRITDDPVVSAWREENFANVMAEVPKLAVARRFGIAHFFGSLFLNVFRGDGRVEALGLAGLRVVTDVGCQKIVAVMNTSDAATGIAFKYHGLGTGSNAEAAGDTTLQTELTTEYNPDSTRATGTQTTGSTTKVYRTVATNTLDTGTPAVTEHGVFSAASAGSLLDRTKFSAINLVGANGDGIQSTYDFTLTSGG